MFTCILPMVGGEYKDCVIKNTFLFQTGDNPSYRIVNQFYFATIEREEIAEILLTIRSADPEWVTLLYRVRGREVPESLFQDAAVMV